MGETGNVLSEEVHENSLYFLLHFALNLKLLFKSILQKKNLYKATVIKMEWHRHRLDI